MLFSEISDAINLACPTMRLIEIARYINILRMDISEALKITNRQDIDLVEPDEIPTNIFALPIDDLADGKAYSSYNSFKIPKNLRRPNIRINNQKLRAINQKNSYEIKYDSNLLPFYYSDADRIYLTAGISFEWDIFLVGELVIDSIDTDILDTTETGYPLDALSYLVNLVASKWYMNNGKEQRSSYYKRMADTDKIRISSRRNKTIVDSWGD